MSAFAQTEPVPWPSGYGEAAAVVALSPEALADSYGLRFFEGSDNLDDYDAAAIQLGSGRRLGLLRHRSNPSPSTEVYVDANDDFLEAVREFLVAFELNADDLLWAREEVPVDELRSGPSHVSFVTDSGRASELVPTSSEPSPAAVLKEVLTHELGDLLYAERRILTMLKTMEKEAADPVLEARIVEHQGETEKQIERLERAFEAIGEKAKAEKCPGIMGLKEEHDSFKREEKPSKEQLAAFDLGSGLRVEHYEIAAYRTAIAISTTLGYVECGRLLQESLIEEEAMARFLEKNAVGSLRKLLATEQANAA